MLSGTLTPGWGIFQPGQSWPDPEDACVSYLCEQQLDKMVVVATKESCPPLSCPDVSPGCTPQGCPSPHSCPSTGTKGTSIGTGPGFAKQEWLLPLLPRTSLSKQ